MSSFPAPPPEQVPENVRRSRRLMLVASTVLALLFVSGVAWFIDWRLHFARYTTASRSMEPTILVGEVITVDRSYYGKHPFADGDIIAFRHGDTILVKRITALPGETIEGRHRTLLRNDVILQEPYAVFREADEPEFETFPKVTVPPGAIFVTGDNRDQSLDSRFPNDFAPVTTSDVIGRVKVVSKYRNPLRQGRDFY